MSEKNKERNSLSKKEKDNSIANGRKYPKKQKEYEMMMRHDAHRRVGGAVRQTRWADND
jgi:hypothetical protein